MAGTRLSGERATRAVSLLRDRSTPQRVTNIELFFDLVYVFAVTQLSHYLLDHPTVRGALQAALLLVMVWLVWAYTTWVTNWLDPEKMPVRLLLVALMLVSLAMSASLPRAFGDLGLWVGGAYALQQVGRSVFMVVAVRGHPLQANYERILAWCAVSGALAVGGGFAHGYLRDVLWLLAVGVDLVGGAVGFGDGGCRRLARQQIRERDQAKAVTGSRQKIAPGRVRSLPHWNLPRRPIGSVYVHKLITA